MADSNVVGRLSGQTCSVYLFLSVACVLLVVVRCQQTCTFGDIARVAMVCMRYCCRRD